MSKRKIALVVAAGLFAAYVFAAPYITVYQIKSAAEAHDGDALSEHIDFPSVRQSVKDQINAMLAKKMVAADEKMKNNPLARLATAALAGAMVEKMVDVYVTPAGLLQLLAGKKPEPEYSQSSTQNPDATADANRKPLADASLAYESLDKFMVRVKHSNGKEGQFILRRKGLIGWKLTDVIVPLE